MKSRLLLCAVAAVSLSALGSSPLAVAPDKAFSIDTSGGICVVTNLSGVSLPYRIAETVTAASSDRETVETLVPVASAAGNYSWTPSAGGAWTLTNSFAGRLMRGGYFFRGDIRLLLKRVLNKLSAKIRRLRIHGIQRMWRM